MWESGSEAGHRCVIGKATEINKILRAIYVNEKKEREDKRSEGDTQSVAAVRVRVHMCVCVCLFMRVLLFFLFCN